MPDIRKVNILIVDDMESNIYTMEHILAKPGRNFIGATSGKDGLKIILKTDINLIILDVQMPEMDGFEFAQIVKSNKKTRDIPIIFASAERKEQKFIMRGFAEGAIDYLSKPLDPEIIEAKVSVFLQLHLQKQEIEQLNADMQKNIVQLEETNKELESFSYSVSHDLRAPLRAINGHVKFLEEDCSGKLDAGATRALHSIKHNSNKMGELIDDLLAFSRLGRQQVKLSEIDMNALVNSVREELLTEDVENRTRLSVRVLPPAKGDPSLIKQVWINLISNAIKYSANKPKIEIEIGAYNKDNLIVYSVKDNGAGFDMQYYSKLFGVFQRLHSEEEFAGTGIGLAIVQKIIHRHNGTVWAESKLNEGTCFYFSLPNTTSLIT